jgi:hypothetical protein
MKILFKKETHPTETTEEEYIRPSLMEDIERTRIALDNAYAGFDNATDPDMIDSYIYEINALLKRYSHLSKLSSAEKIT